MKASVLAAFAVFATVGYADDVPVVGHWLGRNRAITNVNNWAEGSVPGRYIEVVDDAVVSNGSHGGTMIFDEGLAGWGNMLDMRGHISISNVVFRGEDIAEFCYASWGYDSAYLNIEPGGNYIVESSAGKVPFFYDNSAIRVVGVTESGQYVNVINDSTKGILGLCDLRTTQKENKQYETEFRFYGCGDIEMGRNGKTANGFEAQKNGSMPVFVFSQTNGATFKFNSSGTIYARRIIVPPAPDDHGDSRIEIVTNSVSIGVPDSGSADTDRHCLDISRNTVLSGNGKLILGLKQYHPAIVSVDYGNTLTFDVRNMDSEFRGGSKGLTFIGGGNVVFAHAVTNTVEGPVRIESGVRLLTPEIGSKSAMDSPLGQDEEVSISNGGRLVYTGAGETTDRNIGLRWGDKAYLWHDGTGVLELTGSILSHQAVMTLHLGGDASEPAVISGTIAPTSGKSLSVAKSGSGIWRLDAAAGYSGATVISQGTFAVGPNGSLAESPVTLSGGTLVFEGDAETAVRTLSSLTLAAGTASALVIEPGVRVVLPSIVRNDGAHLSVSLGEGASLTFSGLKPGALPSWISTPGSMSAVSADGVLIVGTAASGHQIDAHGGVIPNDANSVVAVVSATGPDSENISLGAGQTAVSVLRQEQSADDAIVSLASGQTLSALMLCTKNGAKDLVVSGAGDAALSGAEGGEVVLAPAEGSEISLEGSLSVSPVRLAGEGTVSVGDAVAMPSVSVQDSPTLSFSGTRRENVQYEISGGELKMTGGGTLLTEEGSAICVGTNGVGKLALEDIRISAVNEIPLTGGIKVGGGVGTLEVSTGAYVTNRICMGSAGSDESVLRISGGTVCNIAPSLAGTFNRGSIFVDIASGAYYGSNQVQWGQSPLQTVFEQRGGVFSQNARFVLGYWDAQLSFIVEGGVFKCLHDIEFPAYNAGNNKNAEGDRLCYAMTVDGTGMLDLWTVNAGRINPSLSSPANDMANPVMLNINGGVCALARIKRDGDYLRSKCKSSRVFVNLNGGTIRMKVDECPFGVPEETRKATGSGHYGVDRVTVFSEGAVLDSNGKSATAHMPFDDPFGKGVVAVPVPEEVSMRTFSAPPAIVIIGDGEGASAHPVFNRESGKVTGVRITSPGWGYTVARARFCAKGFEFRAESECVLSEVSGGTLTKTGSGTYTFACTNTVKSLRVSQGTIAQCVDDAFPKETVLTIDGGIYDLGGKRQTFALVTSTGAGGSIRNGTLEMPGLTFDLADAAAGRVPTIDATLSFPVGAKTTILNASSVASLNARRCTLAYLNGFDPAQLPPLSDETVEALPVGWSVFMVENRLVLGHTTGTRIIFR